MNEKEVWSTLAAAQLAASLVHDGIESFIKAGDASRAEEVIATAGALIAVV